MKRLTLVIVIFLLAMYGCDSKKTEKFECSSTEVNTIASSYAYEAKAVELVTKIIVEITALISENPTNREVEQTTAPVKNTDLINIINDYRSEMNLTELTVIDELCEIAEIRAEEASVLWSHTRPNGKRIDSLLNDTDIKWSVVGENLAKHQNASVETVVDAWMASESHRKNLLNPKFKYCGFAEYNDGEINYVSLILIC